MARKKKQDKSLKVGVDTHSDNHSTGSNPYLAVRVIWATKSQSDSKQITINIAEQDASNLGVRIQDELILLSITEDAEGQSKLSSIVIGRTAITRSERPSPGQSTFKSKDATPGTVIVSPILYGDQPKEPPQTPIETPVGMPPRTPEEKRGFSFKRGGGEGINVQSPSTPSNQRASPFLRGSASQDRYWIMPASSPLGKLVVNTLCSDAVIVTIRPQTEEETAVRSAVRVLERICLANCIDRYVREGELISILFQGKTINVLIESIEGSKECPAVSLDDSFRQMSLQQTSDGDIDGDDSGDSGGERLLRSVIQNANLRLYRIHRGSRLECRVQDHEAKATTDPGRPLVAALTDTVESLRGFLKTSLERSELFSVGGSRMKPPKGVLLHGPSGVAKTLIAKQMEQEFKSRGHDVKYVSCTSLRSKAAVVGEAERHLKSFFHVSNQSKLLILDDIHLVCPRRGDPATGTDQLAATLLALMDGVSSNNEHPFVILAITNNPSLLDSAIRRPGRLDTEIEVPLPDEASSRVEIMKFLLQRMNVSTETVSEEEWLKLGKLAKGFNGSDCMLAMKEAIRIASIRSTQSNQPISADLQLTDLQSAIRVTKPSTIKSITVEIPEVKWSSIGGMETVKRQIKDAIDLPDDHSTAFRNLGISAPNGILLYGPPGCSKTLMARALATEGKMNFLAVKGPELLSKWLGESERALASLFKRARMASPSIIFFDELDAIASKRGSADSTSSGRLLSQMLTELDGINNSSFGGKTRRVVVVGATNRPDLLDSALTRPGRIDRMIYVGVPDMESRAKIFELNLSGKSLDEDVDIKRLSSDEVSDGFSGAEVVAICRDASLLALEESDLHATDPTKVRVGMRHLLQAIRSTPRQITPEMLEFYASFQRKAQ